MLSARERHFVETQRVGRLATADRHAVPHVIPICFSLSEDTLYMTVDQKPKRDGGRALKRLANIADNPRVSMVFDRYDEDWRRLAWVMVHGRAEILADGPEHDRAQLQLRSRYSQLAAMQIEPLLVVAIRIDRVVSWGDLAS